MKDVTYLMLKDVPVLGINLDTGYCKIIEDRYLPYQLKGKLVDVNPYDTNRDNFAGMLGIVGKNRDSFIDYLSGRVLSLDRKNAKKILNILRLSQAQDMISRAKISLSCRSVSLLDDYWVKLSGDNTTWVDNNIRTNKLSNIVATIALHGSSLTLNGKIHTPELTTHGVYAKCWRREGGELYLYKASENGGIESEVEVEVSNILDKCNVSHVKYISAYDNNLYCCKCKCMTSDELSILSGMDFISYCNRIGVSPMVQVMKIDADSMYKMFIVDYLISNPDRHGQNWGFFYDSNTMEILGCHPLYDHNNAFDKYVMEDMSGGSSLFYDGKTQREVALNAMRKVDFRFIERIKRKDFKYSIHYRSFKAKAKVLGLTV